MCTVSYVNSGGKIIITSNRDEQLLRPNAIPPKNYCKEGKNVIYPKDAKAGGTWFVVDEKGTVIVLLNGANKKHESAGNYRKSRGLIVLDLIGAPFVLDFWKEINLNNIEPFTLVLFEKNELFQLRWNGNVKEEVKLNATENYIWSSATLYTEAIRYERESWFNSFIADNTRAQPKDLRNFHSTTQKTNTENGLVINRNGVLQTLSITQAALEQNKVVINHYDLIKQAEKKLSFITI